MGIFGTIKNAVSDFLNEQPDYTEIVERNRRLQAEAQARQMQEQMYNPALPNDNSVYERPPKGVSLYIGQSTGELLRRGHTIGVLGNQAIALENADCMQNVCVMGGVGAGKTTRLIAPCLFQLLNYADIGGLIFDIKGDFKETVDIFADCFNREIIKIGVGEQCRGTNLLKGLTPEQAAGFLQSTFYLTGGKSSDSFWIQSATSLIQNVLGLLEMLGDEYYTLEKLYLYIFFDDIRQGYNTLLDEIQLEPNSLQARNYAVYRGYYEQVFMKLDIKTRESIKGTLATILSPFQNPELIDAFSGATNDYDLYGILGGDIVLVDLPLARWSVAGKVIYTLIKLRFFNLLQTRQVDKSLPQNLVFFMVDEYQEIISASKMGLSDLSFWDKSRSSGCIGIISTQSLSSFKSAIGDPLLCDTILANFRQKVFFRTEDEPTLRYINSLAGRVEVSREGYTESEGDNYGLFHPTNLSQNTSKSRNVSIVERQLVDANLIRQLSGDYAICFLSVENEATDDILRMTPAYPNDFKGKKFLPRLATPQYATQEQRNACDPAYHQEKSAEAEVNAIIAELNNMIGLDSVKQEVNTLLNTVKMQILREQKGLSTQSMSLHLVLTGNPGTGKTTIARLLSRLYHTLGILSKGHIIEATRPDFIGNYLGQTANKTRELCEKAIGGILFIDEAYSLVQKYSGGNADYGQEAVAELIKQMEDHRDNFIVIVAGYEKEMDEFLNTNPEMKSRFTKKIHFPDYTPDELIQVFALYCRKENYVFDEKATDILKAFFERKAKDKSEPFANGRLARNLFEKTLQAQANRLSTNMNADNQTLQTLTRQDIAEAIYQLQ